MKRIIIVTGSLGSGGLERVTALIANHYSNKGWSVFVLCLLSKDNNVFVKLNDDVNVIFYPIKKDISSLGKFIIFRKWISFLKQVFKDIKPDNVLAMTLKIGALCSLSIPKKVRLTLREINDPKSKVRSRFIDSILFFICKRVDSIIFQTEWEAKCYPKKLKIKGRVVPNPIDVNVEASGTFNNEIVTMGRLINDQKRHDILIKAFSIFLKEKPDYVLKIYGDGPDLKKDCKLVDKLNLTDKIFFCGAKKNVHELIKNASIFVMTSEYEGLSNALIEAMLIGIPCITSDWNGSSEIIEDGVTGYIFKRNDIFSLSEKMLALSNDLSLRQFFSNNGKQQKEKYSKSKVLFEYSKIIEGVDGNGN